MKTFLLLFLTFLVQAKDLKFKNFDEAKKSKEYLFFESESTKLGLITTSFEGYPKEFQVQIIKDSNFINNVVITVNSNSLDTDSDSRNEKMYTLCLESKKFNKITFTSNQRIPLKEHVGKFQGNLTIRDKTLMKTIKYKIYKKEKSFYIKGSSSFSLKEYGIPDPSISVASVRDTFDVKFDLKIE